MRGHPNYDSWLAEPIERNARAGDDALGSTILGAGGVELHVGLRVEHEDAPGRIIDVEPAEVEADEDGEYVVPPAVHVQFDGWTQPFRCDREDVGVWACPALRVLP